MARTAVAKAKINLPANIAAEMAAEVAALSERLAKPTGANIKYSKGKFKLPDGTEYETLECIIVDFAYRNRYYSSGFDPDSIVPPDCFAVANKESDMVPVDSAPDVQSTACKGCPQNQFGSANGGRGKGKACQNSIIMAVLPPDADANTQLLTVTVPATSLAYFNKYAGQVAKDEQLPLRAVVTELSTDPDVDWSNVRFSFMNVCTPEQMTVAHARREEAHSILMNVPDFSAEAKPVKKAVGRGKR